MRKIMYLFIFTLFLVPQFGLAVEAAPLKKKPEPRDQFTKEQRAQIMIQARKLCKEKLGPTSVVYGLVIKKKSWTVRCSAY